MNCQICKENLSGRQTKFCCRKCQNQSLNKKHNSYKNQQERGKTRRLKLIEMLGGKCQSCSYCKNQAALSFHHRDPSTKLFGLDLRKCSNSTWEALEAESHKCDLLCLNCHMEEHHPSLEMK